MNRMWLVGTIGLLSLGAAACDSYEAGNNAAYDEAGNAAYGEGGNETYNATDGNAAYAPPAPAAGNAADNAVDDVSPPSDPPPVMNNY